LVAPEKSQEGVYGFDCHRGRLLRLSSIGDVATVLNTADLLAALSIVVGISGGAEIQGHSLRPDFCNPEFVTA